MLYATLRRTVWGTMADAREIADIAGWSLQIHSKMRITGCKTSRSSRFAYVCPDNNKQVL